jgi:hypothetical protein
MRQQEFYGTSYGKWSERGVPHKGWVFVAMEDVEDDLVTCEMCETAQVRFVHIMRHEQYQGELRVGCICAERMEEDYTGPRKRETAYKRGLRRAERMGISLVELLRKERGLVSPIVEAEMARLRKKREENETWLTVVNRILVVGGLNSWEDQFVRDIHERMRRPAWRLSEKQESCLANIWRRTVTAK